MFSYRLERVQIRIQLNENPSFYIANQEIEKINFYFYEFQIRSIKFLLGLTSFCCLAKSVKVLYMLNILPKIREF